MTEIQKLKEHTCYGCYINGTCNLISTDWYKTCPCSTCVIKMVCIETCGDHYIFCRSTDVYDYVGYYGFAREHQ